MLLHISCGDTCQAGTLFIRPSIWFYGLRNAPNDRLCLLWINMISTLYNPCTLLLVWLICDISLINLQPSVSYLESQPWWKLPMHVYFPVYVNVLESAYRPCNGMRYIRTASMFATCDWTYIYTDGGLFNLCRRYCKLGSIKLCLYVWHWNGPGDWKLCSLKRNTFHPIY